MASNFKIIISLFIFIFFNNFIKAQAEKDTLQTTKIFKLGEVVIYSKSKTENVSTKEFEKYNKTDVASALNILPSVVLSKSGDRNESSIYIRGFDIRSIPIYIDGIPIYVPYDGYVDLSRFTTADLSKIEVSKGYSSILYGPNAIGGTINLVSSKPSSKFELKTKAGLLSGNGYNNYISVGSRLEKFYIQGVFTQFDRDYIPLSNNFETSTNESNLKRDNSYNRDRKFTSKFGFTPNLTDEYALSYSTQKGEKGNPVYLGNDSNIKLRFWKWPNWDKESLYFISKTQLNEKMYVKSRLFYDNFKNKLDAFDDINYNTQNTKRSFTSYYNDQTYGANLETGAELKDNILKAAFHYKRDDHKANNEGEKPQKLKDDTYSFGLENINKALTNFEIITGLSYNARKSILAENTNSTNSDGSYATFPKNDNSTVNAQIATNYFVTKNMDLSLTAAYKTRFATMKNRYSYKMGTAIPNPDLKSEEALNFELASTYRSEKISIKPELFYSKIQNTIQLVNNVEPGLSQMQNTGESNFYGADISIGYKPIEFINFLLNYSFIKRKNITNSELLFTDVPENHIFSSTELKLNKNLRFNINGEFSSKRYSTSYGVISPEYTVLNTQITCNFINGIALETGVNNIFDKNYTVTEGYPEAGRNYYFSVYYNFFSN